MLRVRFVQGSPLHETDGHSECVTCLGSTHAEAVLTEASCSHCESTSLYHLHSRIAFLGGSPPDGKMSSAEPRVYEAVLIR